MKKLLMYVNSMNTLGGIERVIANLSSKFVHYYEVTILVKDKPISVYELNSNVIIESINVPLSMNMNSRFKRVVSISLNLIASEFALSKYLKNHRFDYIYVAFPTNGMEVYCTNKYYRNRIIASEHASYYAYNKIYKKIKEWLYPKLCAISVPTSMDTEIYRKLGYKATHIPHLSTYSVTHENRLNSKRIINIGRLTNDKQQKLLIEIWKIVNNEIPDLDWTLQIIGSGENEARLKKLIEALNVKNLEMIPHTQNINDYYRDASLFVLTSRMEGFGMVLLEAMSFGVPCISFDCPSGPRDIISDEKNGFLITCYDKESFANYICKYIKMSDEERRRMSDNAIETIKKWDNQKIVEKWIEMFEGLGIEKTSEKFEETS